MRALVFGLDLTFNGTASQIMSHERAVKTAFLASAPEGTTADIVIATNSSVIDGEPDLFARIPFPVSGIYPTDMIALYNWLDGYPDRYDVMVFSYATDRYYDRQLERMLTDYGLTTFAAMGNSGAQQPFGNNIFRIGGGVTENIRQGGYRTTGYTTAPSRPTSSQTLTSYATARAAAEYLKCKAVGGTLEQVRKRFIQNFAGYPEKSVQNGFGSVPTTYADTTPDLLPPTCLWAYLNGSIRVDGVVVAQEYRFRWCPFYPQSVDGYRIYRGNTLIYEGMGEATCDAGWIGSSTLRIHTYVTTEDGPATFRITSFVGDTESDSPEYSWAVVVIPDIPDPAPEPPAPEPLPPPDPEPELPPVNPTPDIFITRTATALTATNDGGGQTTEWQYRTDISAQWSASVTTDTLSITPDPTATYQLRTRVTSGDITTEWAEAFSTGTQGASLPTIFL